MPEVSIIIPSYNHAAYIEEAVRSVLDQTLPDLELIVVDDGSTDGSRAILRGLSDPRLRVIEQANQGAHAALNCGLREACGEFLAILNSDDAYHPQRLEKTLAALRARPDAGLLGTHLQVIDTGGKPLGVKHGYTDLSPWPLPAPERSFRSGEDLRAALLTENYLATSSNFVLRRAFYERVGEFRPLRYAHDWDFALRAAHLAPLVLLPEPLVRYRVHARNTIRENQVAMVFEILWCLAVHLPQRLTEPAFWQSASPEKRVDQLLNSIFTYDSDLALSVMLLERLPEDLDLALRLLDPADPTRVAYLDFIQRRLAGAEAQQADRETGVSFPRRWLRRLSRAIQRFIP